MNLYQINAEIMKAFDDAVDPETGEIVNEEAFAALDELSVERDTKVENILLWIKNLLSDAEQLKAEKMAFDERKKKVEKKAESLICYISSALDGQKFETTKVTASWRKSEVAVFDGDIETLPDEFKRYVKPEVNKTELKKALKAGVVIAGAHLEKKNNLQIK